MASLDEGVLLHLVAALRSTNPQEQGSALTQLAQLVDISFGEEAERLCAQLRAHGAIEEIGRLLDAPEPYNHQMALLLVGNVASDAVDSHASLTRARLQRVDAFSKLLRYVFSSDWITLVYALGAVQNTCTELEYVEMMQRVGCVPRLQDLIRQGDDPIQQYAQGCLTNMRQTILTASPARRVSDQRCEDAARRVQRHARGRQARKKYGELRLLKDLNGGELPEQAKATAHQQLLRRLEEFKQSPRSRQQSQKSVVVVEEQRPAQNPLEEETAARQRLEMANAAADAAQLAQAALEGKRHRDELMVGRSNSALHHPLGVSGGGYVEKSDVLEAAEQVRSHAMLLEHRHSSGTTCASFPLDHASHSSSGDLPRLASAKRWLADASGSSGSLPTAAVDDRMPVGVRPTPFLQIARPRQVEDRIAISGAGAEATDLRVGDSEDQIAITASPANANGAVVVKCEDQTVNAEAGAETNVAVAGENEGQITISTRAQVNEAVVGVSEDQITITLTGAETIGMVDGESEDQTAITSPGAEAHGTVVGENNEDQMVIMAAGTQADGAVGASEDQLATTSVGVDANGALAKESEEQMVVTDAGADASDEQMVITDAGAEATVAVVGESGGQITITTDVNGAVVGQSEEQMALTAVGAAGAVVGESEEQMVIAARGAEADAVVVGESEEEQMVITDAGADASDEQMVIANAGAEATVAVVGESGGQMTITTDANGAVVGQSEEQMALTAVGANGAVVGESEEQMVIAARGAEADAVVVGESEEQMVIAAVGAEADGAVVGEIEEQIATGAEAIGAVVGESERKMITDAGLAADVALVAEQVASDVPTHASLHAEVAAAAESVVSMAVDAALHEAELEMELARSLDGAHSEGEAEGAEASAPETRIASAPAGVSADRAPTARQLGSVVPPPVSIALQAAPDEAAVETDLAHDALEGRKADVISSYATASAEIVDGEGVQQQAPDRELPKQSGHCEETESASKHEDATDIARRFVRLLIGVAVEQLKGSPQSLPIPFTRSAHEREQERCLDRDKEQREHAADVASSLVRQIIYSAIEETKDCFPRPPIPLTGGDAACEDMRCEGPSATSVAAEVRDAPLHDTLSAPTAAAHDLVVEATPIPSASEELREMNAPHLEGASPPLSCHADSSPPSGGSADKAAARSSAAESIQAAMRGKLSRIEVQSRREAAQADEGAVEESATPCVAVLDVPDAKQQRPSSGLGSGGTARQPLEQPTEQHPSSPNIEGAVEGTGGAQGSATKKGVRKARFSELTEGERLAAERQAARARQLEEIRSKQKEEERRALEREAAAAAAAAAEQEKRRLAALEAARQRRAKEDVCNAAVRFEVAGFERDRERRAMECIKRWLRCAVRRYRARKKRKELSEGKQKKKLELEAAQRKFEATQRKQAAEASRKQRAKMQHDAEQHLKKMEADRAQAAVKLQSASRREQARKTFKLKKQSAITIERYHRGRLARRHCSSQKAERQTARRYELAALGIQASYRRSKSIVVAKQRRQRLLVLKSRGGSPPGRGSPADFFAANLQAVHRGKKARRRAEQLRAKEAAERAEWATLRYGLHQSISMKLSAESSQVVDINGPEVVAVVSAAFETTSAMWRLAHSPRNKRRRPIVRGFDIEPEGTLFGMPPPHRPRSGRPPTPSVSAAPPGVSPLLKHLPASLHARASHVASEQMGHSFSLPLLASASPRSLSPQLGASSRADRSKPLSLESQLARTKSNLSLGSPIKLPPIGQLTSVSTARGQPSSETHGAVATTTADGHLCTNCGGGSPTAERRHVDASGDASTRRAEDCTSSSDSPAHAMTDNSQAAQRRLGSTLSFPQLPIKEISEEPPPHCSCSNAALDDLPLDCMPIALEQRPSIGKSHMATEELRRRLAGHTRKVLEAFEYWAADRDKQISRDEFRRTLKTSARDLDLRCSKADIDSLFDSLDESGKGTIKFVDLKRMLLQEQQLTRSLRERGVTKYALRNRLQHSTSASSKRHLQLGTHTALAEELRLSLTANAARAVDLFKKWDADGDGAITRSEFHRAIPMLGIVAPPREIDRIFDEFDLDGSGDISSAELHHALRVGATVQLPPKLQAGGAGEIVLKAKTQQPLRSKPKPIRELDELLKMLPGGARHADLPVELPAGVRQPGLSIGRLRSQLRGHDTGLEAQITPLASREGNAGESTEHFGASVCPINGSHMSLPSLCKSSTDRPCKSSHQSTTSAAALYSARDHKAMSSSRPEIGSRACAEAHFVVKQHCHPVACNSLSTLVATKKAQRAWDDDKRVQPGAKFFPIRQLRTFVEVDSDD